MEFSISQHTLSVFVTIVHTVTRTRTCLDRVMMIEAARLVIHLILRSKSRLLVTLATPLAVKGVALQRDNLLRIYCIDRKTRL